jgi:hypothetical protein
MLASGDIHYSRILEQGDIEIGCLLGFLLKSEKLDNVRFDMRWLQVHVHRHCESFCAEVIGLLRGSHRTAARESSDCCAEVARLLRGSRRTAARKIVIRNQHQEPNVTLSRKCGYCLHVHCSFLKGVCLVTPDITSLFHNMLLVPALCAGAKSTGWQGKRCL